MVLPNLNDCEILFHVMLIGSGTCANLTNVTGMT